MRKLHLDLDELVVDTFDTTAAGAKPGGTVLGHDGPSDSTCLELLCTCGGSNPSECGGCGTGVSDCQRCPSQFTCYDHDSCDTACAGCMWSAQETCGDSCGGTCAEPECWSVITP